MMQDKVDRRAAIRLAMLMLGGAAITISGCGGGDSSPAGPNPNPTPTPTPTPTPGGGDKSGQISANHGHVATLSAAELTAGMGLSLGIRGSATHNHNIALTGAQVVSVRDGARVQILSSNDDGHNHTVSFN
jgi:hypothetical protein